MQSVIRFFKSRAGMTVLLALLLFTGFYFIRTEREKSRAEALAAKKGTVDKTRVGQMSPESEPVEAGGGGPRRTVVGEGKVISYTPAPYTPPAPAPAPAPAKKSVPEKEKAPPPPPIPKLVHRVSRPEDKPFSYHFPKTFAPAGTMIPCYLSVTVDSANFETPVIGKVEEPVFFNKRLIIPKGTEVHAFARQGRLRDRIAITGSWRFVWSGGKELVVRGIALDRKYDPVKDSYGITDGSAGIRGTLYKGEQNEELKLLAASFASGLAKASQQSSTNGFGQRTPDVTVGNSVRQGAAEVADRWADRILDDILTEGYYVRVPAGTQFYIYVTQTLEPELASFGGLRQASQAATSHDRARSEYEARQHAAGTPPAQTWQEPASAPGGTADIQTILRQRDQERQTARLYQEQRDAAKREEARLRRVQEGLEREEPPLPSPAARIPQTSQVPARTGNVSQSELQP